MADKKIDKALYGPSTFEVALGALLGLLVGVLAACVFLIFKPVRTVKELPKEPEIGAIYYIAGKVDTSRGRSWTDKQRQFISGASVNLTEEEVNAWAVTLDPDFASKAAAAAKPAPPPAKPVPGKKPAAPTPPPAAASAPKATPTGFFNVSSPIFRLAGNQLQIASTVTLNFYGTTFDVMLVATGGFVRDENHIVFRPEKYYLGSCPLHRIPMLAKPVTTRFYAAQKVTEELQVAWEKVTAVTVENGLLRISTAP